MATKTVTVEVHVEVETSGAIPTFLSVRVGDDPRHLMPPGKCAPRRFLTELAAAAATKLAAPKT